MFRAILDWLGDLAWNIIYPPSLLTEEEDAYPRQGIAMLVLAAAWFPAPFVIGTAIFGQLEPSSPWVLGYMGWLGFIGFVHASLNWKAYLVGLSRILGYALYPAGAVRTLLASGDGSCRHRRRGTCWPCFGLSTGGLIAAWCIVLGGVVALFIKGYTIREAWPFTAWAGIAALTTAWFFRQAVLDVLAWLLVRACRILHPPLMVGRLRNASEPCEYHGKEGCGLCGLAAFFDIMGTITAFLLGCYMLATYGWGLAALPFIIWAAAAVSMPVAVRLYRWADGVAQREAMLEAAPVMTVDLAQPPPAPAALTQVPRPEEPAGAPLPPEPLPYQDLLDAITGTAIEEATPEKLTELSSQVTAFEQEHGQDVPALRDALTALAQMASTAQSPQ